MAWVFTFIIVGIAVAIIFGIYTSAAYFLRKYKKFPGQRFEIITKIAAVVASCCTLIVTIIVLYQYIFPPSPIIKQDPFGGKSSIDTIIPPNPLPLLIDSTEAAPATVSGSGKKEYRRQKPDTTPPPIPPDSKTPPQYALTFDISPPRKNIEMYIDGKFLSSKKFFTAIVDSGNHEVRATSEDRLGTHGYHQLITVCQDDTIVIMSSDFTPDR